MTATRTKDVRDFFKFPNTIESSMSHTVHVHTARFENKNSSGDEIANVNFLTTISHTRRPTSKYRKRDKPTSFNKLDDR